MSSSQPLSIPIEPEVTRTADGTSTGPKEKALQPTSSASSAAADDLAYHVYPQRWYGLIVVFILTFANSVVWINYAPISSLAGKYYGVGDNEINGFSIVYLAFFGPGYLIALWAIEKYGIRRSIIVAGFVQAFGAWVRVMGCKDNQTANAAGWQIGMVGQAMMAITGPTFNMLPCRYAVEWFPSRILAATSNLMVISNPFGSAIGSFVPSLVVDDSGGLMTLLIGVSILCTLGAVMSIFFPSAFEDLHGISARIALGGQEEVAARALLRPPPSAVYARKREEVLQQLIRDASEEAREERERNAHLRGLAKWRVQHPLVNDLYLLVTNWHFMMLFVGYFVGVGIANAFITLIEQMIRPSGYDKDAAGNFGGLIIAFGLTGSFVSSTILDKLRRRIELAPVQNPADPLDKEHRISRMYRNVLRCFLVASMAAVVWTLLCLRPGIPLLLGAAFAVVGFCVLPLLPIMILLSSDCAPQVSDDASTGLLQCGSNYGGICFIGIFSGLIQLQSDTYSTVFTPSSIAIFFFLLACVIVVSIGYNYQAKPMDAGAVAPAGEAGKEAGAPLEAAASAALPTPAIEPVSPQTDTAIEMPILPPAAASSSPHRSAGPPVEEDGDDAEASAPVIRVHMGDAPEKA